MSARNFFGLVLAAAGLFFATGAHAQGDGYRLNPGDILQVSVWKEEELTREILVRPDGGVTFPLVGEIRAAERTPEQVQTAITTRLEQYVPDAVVTVAVVSVNGNKIYVLGKVARPGEFIVNKQLDVMQALAVAGGPTSFASANKIKILRRAPNGAQQAIPFKYSSVESGNDLDMNIMLKSGDVVVVP